jgi:hypothetical protein
MPDHWDTKPENVFSLPAAQPDPAPNGHLDHPKEIKLTDDRGRLRLPAYIMITMVIAAAALLLVATGLLLAPG